MECATKYRAKTNHTALNKVNCSVCWELVFEKSTEKLSVGDPTTLETLTTLKTLGSWNPKADPDFAFTGVFSTLTGLPLLHKGMDPINSTVTTCHYCLSHLQSKKLPPRSTANKLWFGDPSELMKNLTLTGRLLVCPIRQKVYIVKMKVKADPRTLQNGVLGSTIAFPQDNAMAQVAQLPHPLSELARSLQVIFVGSKEPSEAQLSKVFRVDASEMEQALDEFRDNGHQGFRRTKGEAEHLLGELDVLICDGMLVKVDHFIFFIHHEKV